MESEYSEVLDDLAELKKFVTKIQVKIRGIERRANLREKKNSKKKNKKTTGICKPVKVSEELYDFMNLKNNKEIARTEVTRYINKYIKDHSLQSSENKQVIIPDEKLKNLLKVNENEEVNYFNLQKYMNPHFQIS